MSRFIIVFILLFAASTGYSQELPSLKLIGNGTATLGADKQHIMKHLSDIPQVKKRKAVNAYFGAGYSFVIFTAKDMNSLYPVFNQSAGDFLSEINLFFGFAIAKAVTLEIEPSILFTNNNKLITFVLAQPRVIGGYSYSYANTSHASMLAFPVSANARFFPFFKMDKSFIRLFFVGGGAGMAWIREEYDNYYSNTPGINYYSGGSTLVTESTSQWAPLFRAMIGFTGSGGQFGFGGELRFNVVPLKSNGEAFVTRTSSNFNSVDLALRFYFSL